MLAYGKMPGGLFATDSVQYDLGSPQLRAMAIRTIKEFARRTSGIRIEGASFLLRSRMIHYWNGRFLNSPNGQKTEFWKEVIDAL